MKKTILSILILPFLVSFAYSADLMRILPVNDRILMLHFDEGHVDYGSGSGKNKVYRNKLDVGKATVPSNYTITSGDDENYTAGSQPVRINRKAKSLDINNMYQGENKWILDHWVYLTLPKPLKQGKTYTVKLNIADNTKEYTLTFDVNRLRTESVHVNLAGYVPGAAKYAYISHWMGDGGGVDFDTYTDSEFRIVKYGTDQILYTGTITKRKDSSTGKPISDSGADGQFFNRYTKRGPRNIAEADVWECDFTRFDTPGEYVLAVDHVGCSFPFRIGANVYRDAFYTVCKGIFFERAGIEKELEKGMIYRRDHHPDNKQGKFFIDTDWRWIDKPSHGFKAKDKGTFNVWGWYHDAGDWDGYPHHIRISYSLMLLYDLVPENFKDGDVNNRYKKNETGKWYCEGENGIPDILDEAAWLVEYYRRTRAEGLKTGLGTGGVPGAYSGVDSCGKDGASWLDTRDCKFSAEDPATTYDYAAGAAWLAACLDKAKGEEHPDSAGWLKEAETAYEWAEQNTRSGDEKKVVKDRLLAAAALYRYTKDAAYQDDYADAANKDPQYIKTENGWFGPSWWQFAVGIYALLPDDFPGLNIELRNEAREKTIQAADVDFIATAAKRGYRLGFDWNKLHSIGTMSTPMTYALAVAYKITGEKKYLDCMYTTTSYFLGGNPMNMSWVTGFGARHVRYPFHPDSWVLYDFNSKVYSNEIIMGIVPYGSCGEGDFFGGTKFNFTGDEDFSHSSAYPAIGKWPIGEMRFGNRYSIAASEFTVAQNMAPSAFAYGFLSGKANDFKPDERPTVKMKSPKDGASFKPGSDITFEAEVSDNTRTVEYYYEEHFIGETSEKPFSLVWKNVPAGEYTITAKVIDKLGRLARPNAPENDVDVKITVVESQKPKVEGPH